MAKSKVTYMKNQLEKVRKKKREDKQQRKEERKKNPGGTAFEDMIAYVNENGEIVSTPPEKPAPGR